MGRGVEQTMLHVLVAHGRSRGLRRVTAEHLATERNKPCLDFFQDQSSFRNGGEPGRFFWETSDELPAPPAVELSLDYGDPA
jgi:predicted enzyme involved in methoxymalonyl-ACP biosynthesis